MSTSCADMDTLDARFVDPGRHVDIVELYAVASSCRR